MPIHLAQVQIKVSGKSKEICSGYPANPEVIQGNVLLLRSIAMVCSTLGEKND